MIPAHSAVFHKFGFRFGRGGTHTRRTLMLAELSALLNYVGNRSATKGDYRHAVVKDNCLGKRSSANREMTFKYLRELYALDPGEVLFRSLLFFWDRDEAGRPLLALLCAYARDAILRSSAPFVLAIDQGDQLEKDLFEQYIDSLEPGRYSETTLDAVASRLMSTWTQSGHLQGRQQKVRVSPTVTPGAVAYALFLGYLRGLRGTALFESEYARLLDCTVERVVGLAEESSRSGWIIVNRIGNVVEVLFPRLLTEQEMEWLHEQA